MALNGSPEFCLKLLYRYLLKAGHFPGDTWVGHFWPQGLNLNKLSKVLQVMLHTKYQCSRPCGFRQEDFLCFPYISLCKTCDPLAALFLKELMKGGGWEGQQPR